jgi:hypothetical protein
MPADVLERLLKPPQEFEVRSYRASAVHKQVFEQYAAVFDAQNEVYFPFRGLPIHQRLSRQLFAHIESKI